MPQRIVMEEPELDINKLQDIVYGLEQFGIIHEDKTNDIIDTMGQWVYNNPTYNTELLAEMEENGEYNVEDSESIQEYIWDNYGSSHWYDLVLGKNISQQDKEKAALMFRHIVAEYFWANGYGKDRDEVIAECEGYLED